MALRNWSTKQKRPVGSKHIVTKDFSPLKNGSKKLVNKAKKTRRVKTYCNKGL